MVLPQDGNGYVPDGYWPPMPAPTRSKPIPLGYPLKQTGMEFIPYPHPTGNPYPTGIPYPPVQQFNPLHMHKYNNFKQVKYNKFQQMH
jgi:hypothetical protein